MNLKESELNNILVIHLEGRFDAASAYVAEEKLNKTIAAGRRQIIIDLGGVDYISSGGLRVLLSTAKKLDRLNGAIRLACLSESVREVMDVAGFCQIFQMYDSVESAAAGFTIEGDSHK